MALPLTHRTDPYDATAIAIVYPIHNVIGRNAWFGRCPASQLVVEPALTPAGRETLAQADDHFVRQLAERATAEAERQHRERVGEIVLDMIGDTLDTDDPMVDSAGRRYVHPPGTVEGWQERRERERERGTPAPPSVDDYFPGRPADAPEPGVGDEPAAKLPLDQIGQPLGKAHAMSTLEQHLAMLAATRRKIGEAQEAVAIAIAGLETLEAATAQLGPHCDAAAALADATVGILSAPSDAVLMRANLAAAKETATGADSIVQATGLVRARLMAIAGSLASASSRAETYAAQQHG